MALGTRKSGIRMVLGGSMTMLPRVNSTYGAPRTAAVVVANVDKSLLKTTHEDTRPDSDYDPVQLKKGIAVEMEHTDDRNVASKIAKDHLDESELYYVDLEKMEKKENIGGPGSGNFGHVGRPGEVGGSGEGAPSTSVKERDRRANASVSVPARVNEHISSMGAWQSSGDLDKDVDARINSAKDLLHPESAHLAYETMSRYTAVLRNAGVSEDKVTALTQLGTDYLIAQEIEAQGRQLGDHGVHHIAGNIERSMQLMGVIPGEDTGEQEAAIFTANLFHDAGYLTTSAQHGDDEGHARWSADNYDKNIRPAVEAALGREEAANVEHLIRTHDATTIDWKSDPVGSSVRVADNTALFQADKLPPIFREVPGNLETLESFNAGEISLSAAKTAMHKAVDAEKLPSAIAARYHMAVDEVNPATGKFTLGMMGGTIEKVSWVDGHVAIDLKESDELTRVNKLGDFGQRQFGKFAETFGVNPDEFKKNLAFAFKGKDGTTLLEGRIIKAKTNIGTSESGNYGHAGRPGERGGSAPGEGSDPNQYAKGIGRTPATKATTTITTEKYAAIKADLESRVCTTGAFPQKRFDKAMNQIETMPDGPEKESVRLMMNACERAWEPGVNLPGASDMAMAGVAEGLQQLEDQGVKIDSIGWMTPAMEMESPQAGAFYNNGTNSIYLRRSNINDNEKLIKEQAKAFFMQKIMAEVDWDRLPIPIQKMTPLKEVPIVNADRWSFSNDPSLSEQERISALVWHETTHAIISKKNVGVAQKLYTKYIVPVQTDMAVSKVSLYAFESNSPAELLAEGSSGLHAGKDMGILTIPFQQFFRELQKVKSK